MSSWAPTLWSWATLRWGTGPKLAPDLWSISPVPPGATVIGVPGRITRINGQRLQQSPVDILDHASLPDPVVETLKCLVDRVELLENQVRQQTKITPVAWDEEVPVACYWLAAEEERQRI